MTVHSIFIVFSDHNANTLRYMYIKICFFHFIQHDLCRDKCEGGHIGFSAVPFASPGANKMKIRPVNINVNFMPLSFSLGAVFWKLQKGCCYLFFQLFTEKRPTLWVG